jgi:hypothetical protein
VRTASSAASLRSCLLRFADAVRVCFDIALRETVDRGSFSGHLRGRGIGDSMAEFCDPIFPFQVLAQLWLVFRIPFSGRRATLQ